MNRRNLFQRAGATTIGALAALIGIQPKKVVECSPSEVECCECDALSTFSTDISFEFLDLLPSLPYKATLDKTGDGPLQLWLGDRFYVDLPEERYTDTVYVDWMVAKEAAEGEGDWYVAKCRVCPDFGEPWEVLPMKRVNG